MDDLKRLGLPFITILVTFLIVTSLFLFGYLLNKTRNRRNPGVFKKVIAILVMLLLMLMQMGYFTLPFMADAFDFFGVDAFYINMIYIFCGYLFAD